MRSDAEDGGAAPERGLARTDRPGQRPARLVVSRRSDRAGRAARAGLVRFRRRLRRRTRLDRPRRPARPRSFSTGRSCERGSWGREFSPGPGRRRSRFSASSSDADSSLVRTSYRMAIDLGDPDPGPRLAGRSRGARLCARRRGGLLRPAPGDASGTPGSRSRRHTTSGPTSSSYPRCWFLRCGLWPSPETSPPALRCATRMPWTAASGGCASSESASRFRGRGLGRALLLHAFTQFRHQGLTRAGLGVDSESPTGANKLYESVGMHVSAQFAIHEKALA